MNAASDVTPVILTFNEAPNIGAALQRLGWAKRVVVLDSFSNDKTAEIAKSFANVDFHVRSFESHSAQWNHAVSLSGTEWILSLDADYLIPDEFANELMFLESREISAYFAAFEYRIFGHRLRSTLYPARAVLFRRSRCNYEQDGHTQMLRIQGKTAFLKSIIGHDDRKSLGRWLQSQDRYAALEANKLTSAQRETLRMQDRLRLWVLPAPFVVLFYTLLWKRLILDGWPGWFYTFQRVTAEVILSMHLLQSKLERTTPNQRRRTPSLPSS
jgi:glycosyltransferase involved in cell wall biosynthesis